jgi:hypothetical protein
MSSAAESAGKHSAIVTALAFMTSRLQRRKSSAPFSRDSKDFARRLSLASTAFIRPLSGALVDHACSQAKAADQEVITGVSTQNVELDELYSFAGEKRPDEQESDVEEVGQHWTHVAMARESRLMLEVVVGPRAQEYGQVIKQRAGRRLVSAPRRVFFGVAELIPLEQISTSLLERLNGTIRRRVAPRPSQGTQFRQARNISR